MPTKPATTTFNDFINAAVAKIPDPTIQQRFTTTFGQLLSETPANVISELDNQTASNLMFHRDYSRLVAEHRQQAEQLTAREQHLQQLQQSGVTQEQFQQIQTERDQLRDKAAGVDTLLGKLDAMDLTELVLDADEIEQFRRGSIGDTTMPEPATSNNGNQPPANQPAPQWINGQWYLPAPVAPAPMHQQQQQQHQFQQPAPAAPNQDIEAIVNARVQAALGEVLPAAMAQVYGASSQTALEMQGFAHEWKTLKGEDIDPRALNQEFVQSGQQMNDFLENKFKLSEVRTQKQQADYQAAVDAAATQKAEQLYAERVTAGAIRGGVPSNGSIPLFDAIANRPVGLRQANTYGQQQFMQPNSNPQTPGQQQPPTPQAAPTATSQPQAQQQQPATPPPNPGDMAGVDAAARALSLGTYANSRFDPTRPLGVPGMA